MELLDLAFGGNSLAPHGVDYDGRATFAVRATANCARLLRGSSKFAAMWGRN
jgi:hypothetical protein